MMCMAQQNQVVVCAEFFIGLGYVVTGLSFLDCVQVADLANKKVAVVN